MEKKLQLLDSFDAQGSDGEHYKVMAFEHLVQTAPPLDGHEHWESTGQTEYRLADGGRIDAAPDGTLRVARNGVELKLLTKG